ncbi:MAG: sigma-54-dependent Fis family transcriptional regulator [Agathobaculum sp.]|uniref:sigma-54-dependent Fis family transcriptional regulator n=1 Tax=Agathobaculum sp. TaxID=2048138 RepID=UPI003D8BB19F
MNIDQNYAPQWKAREDFFLRGVEDYNIFPSEVYESWKRSLDYGLDPNVQNIKMLSPDELQQRLQQNHLLISIATSFMEYLHNMVKGSGYVIMLADADGYILKVIGDPDTLSDIRSKSNPVVEGVCRHESAFGTGGIGTPIATRKPIQLSCYEMFYPSTHEFTGSGAPLVDANGRVYGALCLSSPLNQTHPHTLGMVAAASYAIMRQYSLQNLYDQLVSTESQLQTILSTINYGVFLLDRNFTIVDTNNAAIKALNYLKNELIGTPISKIIPSLDFSKLIQNLHDEEYPLHGKYSTINAFITVQLIRGTDGALTSMLISFRQSTSMRKFVTRYIGSTASFQFDDIIGQSKALTTAKTYAQIASSNSANVLLLGESGTGKELFAQSIHNNSQFSSGPFVAVNCGAIPKSLVESELFGYESGSFTGAKREGSAGKFELANNGTIFLDEIGDMPYEVQVHLLRILQTKEVTRIGGKKSIALNIRVIAGTNVDLLHAIEEKTFRSDLYYRLNVLSIQIPTLKERGNDIMILTDYFIKKYQPAGKTPILGVTAEVADLFMRYPWPGNIRELENTIERACLLASGEYITPEHIPWSIVHYQPVASTQTAIPVSPAPIPGTEEPVLSEEPDHTTINEAERALITRHLQDAHGNIKKAADSLGISRRTLYRKLEKYEINYQDMRT